MIGFGVDMGIYYDPDQLSLVPAFKSSVRALSDEDLRLVTFLGKKMVLSDSDAEVVSKPVAVSTKKKSETICRTWSNVLCIYALSPRKDPQKYNG